MLIISFLERIKMTGKLRVSIDGGLLWFNAEGKKHREDDKPAVIHPDGSIELWDSGARYYLVDEKKDCGNK